MDSVALLASVAAAVAVLLLIVGVFGSSRPVAAERLDRFIGGAQPAPQKARSERPSIGELVTRSPALLAVNRLVERRTWSEEIARDMARADLTLRPLEYLAIRALVVVAAVGLVWTLGATIVPTLSNPIMLLLAGLIGLFLPRLWISRRQQRRLNAFNANLADTITLVANALRSGSSLLQAIEMVVRETEPPISTEFNRVIREVNLGITTENALNNLVRRVRSSDLELMATAITIQHQVGGNLAEILDTIAFTIRERVRIKGEIRTLTAQQRLSGYVVGFLPIALMGVISILAPSFIGAMFESPPEMFGLPLGVILLIFGGVLMLIGFSFIRRIVDIQV